MGTVWRLGAEEEGEEKGEESALRNTAEVSTTGCEEMGEGMGMEGGGTRENKYTA
jgi:hypothetical protein